MVTTYHILCQHIFTNGNNTYHMIQLQIYIIFPHNLLTNLTTKLTAGIHPAAHSLVVETKRHAPLILLLLLLLLPIILPIPKSFDSTAFNRKQLIMDIDSIEYNCKQVICWYYWCVFADVIKIMRVELVNRCIAINSQTRELKIICNISHYLL